MLDSYSQNVAIELFDFLSIQGFGSQIPWGCARSIFQGSQGLKLFFLGGQDKFSRGVMLVRASRGTFSRGLFLENWFPKGDFWKKNGIAHCRPSLFNVTN